MDGQWQEISAEQRIAWANDRRACAVALCGRLVEMFAESPSRAYVVGTVEAILQEEDDACVLHVSGCPDDIDVCLVPRRTSDWVLGAVFGDGAKAPGGHDARG